MEIWKDVIGFDYEYEVSNMGRIKAPNYVDTLGRKRRERILSGTVNNLGYIIVSLRQNGKRKTVSAHSIVSEAFLGHSRDGLFSTGIINHIDEVKTNNAVSNLEVTTQRQNNIHSKTKRSKYGLPANIRADKRRKNPKYIVQIGHGISRKIKDGKGCQIYLGCYETLVEAIAVRDKYYHELENCKFQHLEIL
jgi:hypothetical protein